MPFKKPFVTARKVNDDTVNFLARVYSSTDSGEVIGIGESQPKSQVTGDLGPDRAWAFFTEASATLEGKVIDVSSPRSVRNSIKKALVDVDALASDYATEENRDHPFRGSRMGLEIALLDLAGQVRGDSIAKLLGGTQRSTVTANSFTLSATNDLDDVRQKVAFHHPKIEHIRVKVKGSLSETIELMHAIHDANMQAGGARSIWIDFNESLSPKHGAELMRVLAEGISAGSLPEVLTVEQPYKKSEIESLPELQKAADKATSDLGTGEIRVMPDESLWDIQDLETIERLGGCRAINIKVAKAGGLIPSVEIARRAVELNPSVNLYIGGILGASDITAWSLHQLAKAFPQLQYFSSTPPRNFLQRISHPPVRVKRGTLQQLNSQRKGLGAELLIDELAPYIEQESWSSAGESRESEQNVKSPGIGEPLGHQISAPASGVSPEYEDSDELVSPEEAKTYSKPASWSRWFFGHSFTEGVKHAKCAQEQHGISGQEFIENDIYKIKQEHLGQLKKSNRFVELVSDRSNISYNKAFASMYEVRNKYGIGFREFAQSHLDSYDSEADLRAAIVRLIAIEGDYIRQVCRETGWGVERAEQRLRQVKSKWPTIDARKFSGYGFYAMTDDEIRQKVQSWNATAKSYRETVAEAAGWTIDEARSHITRFQVKYDIIPAYYMCYRGWELSDSQIDGYARQKLSEEISERYNTRAHAAILNNKDQFDLTYAEFVKRKFWVNDPSATFNEFAQFADGLDEAFCKPLRSGGGLGTFKIDLNVTDRELRDVYEDLMSKSRVLLEESVKQHDEVSEFYPHSVNTVRVVVVQEEGSSRVLSAGFRFGYGSITDNFSADGMVADIDIKTGVISTPAVNKKGESYESHPYSNKPFVGFKVPHWDEAISISLSAMDVLSGINYVGWDLAIGPHGVSIIEGNSRPDLVLVQAPYAPMKIGKKYLFEPYLK